MYGNMRINSLNDTNMELKTNMLVQSKKLLESIGQKLNEPVSNNYAAMAEPEPTFPQMSQELINAINAPVPTQRPSSKPQAPKQQLISSAGKYIERIKLNLSRLGQQLNS